MPESKAQPTVLLLDPLAAASLESRWGRRGKAAGSCCPALQRLPGCLPGAAAGDTDSTGEKVFSSQG